MALGDKRAYPLFDFVVEQGMAGRLSGLSWQGSGLSFRSCFSGCFGHRVSVASWLLVLVHLIVFGEPLREADVVSGYA